MSRTVYKYTVEVLKKVSFNPKLFKRELEKASKKLLPHEYTELMIWAKNFKFQNPTNYNDQEYYNSVSYTHLTLPTNREV